MPCIGAVRLPKGQTPIWESLFDHKLADDTWLWQVSFEGKILPPNKVITHNEFGVLIDMKTGQCGMFR